MPQAPPAGIEGHSTNNTLQQDLAPRRCYPLRAAGERGLAGSEAG